MNATLVKTARYAAPLAAGLCAITLAGCGGGTAAQAGDVSAQTVDNPSPVSTATPPAGLPRNWSELAVKAADNALQHCAQSISLAPAGCPQQATDVAGDDSMASGQHWFLLDGGLQHPVAVPGPDGQVQVYGMYRMYASYSLTGQGIRPSMAYSGGAAEASMTWDGTSFQTVNVGAIERTQWAPGYAPPVFARPATVTDAAALAAVQAGFQDCATLPPPLVNTADIPGCPQLFAYPEADGATSAHWTIDGDPTQGALASFDTAHGDVTVGGTFRMTLSYDVSSEGIAGGSHTAVSAGNYVATLVWDGQKLVLIGISAS